MQTPLSEATIVKRYRKLYPQYTDEQLIEIHQRMLTLVAILRRIVLHRRGQKLTHESRLTSSSIRSTIR